MAVIRKPDVPAGPHRRLVDALHDLYLGAGAPSLREIAERGAISRDTAHRVLTSPVVPTWPALAAVVTALGGDFERFRAFWAEARRGGAPAPAAAVAAVAPGGESPRRLLVVEDHPLYREALVRAMSDAGHTIVGTASDGEAAVSLALATRPEVILMDNFLPGLQGIDAAARIRSADPDIRILIITAAATADLTLRALRTGVQGVLSKDSDAAGIDRAVRAAWRGEIQVPAGFDAAPAAEGPATAGRPFLTPQERRVLQLVADGSTDAEIAERLALSLRTVRSYLERVRSKSGLRRRSELVRFAVETGLVPPAVRRPPGGAGPAAGDG
ncbi:response regulator transcription factor [Amycolatopsis sp. NPDC021455]|uniref:response regulator transcription factor n=1 Tax=Amycolatopsis sp. NPDC021455 TaxID=3154901 RepID=UPI003406EB89